MVFQVYKPPVPSDKGPEPQVMKITGMDFPPYEYEEFPKWIYGTNKESALVGNKEEEEALMHAWEEASPSKAIGVKTKPIAAPGD